MAAFQRIVVSGGTTINCSAGEICTNPETYAGNGAAAEVLSGGVLYTNGANFADNGVSSQTTDQGSGGAICNGGTVYVSGGSFTNNTAVIHGGAVCNVKSGTLNVSKATFTGNSLTDSKGQGGAICNGGTVNLSGAVLAGNSTTGNKGQGGAVYNTGIAVVSGGTISTNRATMGGAVFNNGGSLKITGTTVSGNRAKYGGAIQNFSGGTVNVTSAVFSGNTAADNGGAIAHNTGSATISNTTFSSNKASKTGGAIQNTSTLTLAGVIFSGNTASSGGALCNEGTVNLKGTVTLATETDDIYNKGTLNWDLSSGTASYGSIDGYQHLDNQAEGELTITVSSAQPKGSYVLATGDFTDLTNKNTFTLTGISGEEDVVITVGGTSVQYDETEYTLAVKNSSSLVLSVGGSGKTAAVSDYNGSGKSDMIQFVNGKVYVTYDNGSNYVQTPPVNDVSGWNVVETRRDLTGDGYADIQITSDDGAGSTWVATLRNDYLQTGCITLNYQFVGAYDNQLWSYLGSADFNGDGKSEILMVQTEAGKDSYGHRNVVAWVTDEESCLWVDNIWLGALNDGWNVAGTADLTGDGKDNLILRGADGMIGYWADFGGMPEDIVELKNAGNRILLTTGDFDGDGAADFLWQTMGSDEFSTWTSINGTMSDTVIGNASDLSGNWAFAGVGDCNGDGKDEILWCDTTTYKTAYSEGSKENFTKLTVIA